MRPGTVTGDCPRCGIHDLWEVRSSLSGGKIARVIFCVDKGRMVSLHGFIQNTRKTPKKDLDLALKRKKVQDQ